MKGRKKAQGRPMALIFCQKIPSYIFYEKVEKKEEIFPIPFGNSKIPRGWHIDFFLSK